MAYCKHCGEYVPEDTSVHVCPDGTEHYPGEDNSFLTSVIIGAATDSAILGGLLGGDRKSTRLNSSH